MRRGNPCRFALPRLTQQFAFLLAIIQKRGLLNFSPTEAVRDGGKRVNPPADPAAADALAGRLRRRFGRRSDRGSFVPALDKTMGSANSSSRALLPDL